MPRFTSTADAEQAALCLLAKRMHWINNALNSVGMDQSHHLQDAFTDNGPLINRVENPQRINQKRRFNHIRYWYVIESCNEHEELRFIRLDFIASKLNPTDQYTKILAVKEEVRYQRTICLNLPGASAFVDEWKRKNNKVFVRHKTKHHE